MLVGPFPPWQILSIYHAYMRAHDDNDFFLALNVNHSRYHRPRDTTSSGASLMSPLGLCHCVPTGLSAGLAHHRVGHAKALIQQPIRLHRPLLPLASSQVQVPRAHTLQARYLAQQATTLIDVGFGREGGGGGLGQQEQAAATRYGRREHHTRVQRSLPGRVSLEPQLHNMQRRRGGVRMAHRNDPWPSRL